MAWAGVPFRMRGSRPRRRLRRSPAHVGGRGRGPQRGRSSGTRAEPPLKRRSSGERARLRRPTGRVRGQDGACAAANRRGFVLWAVSQGVCSLTAGAGCGVALRRPLPLVRRRPTLRARRPSRRAPCRDGGGRRVDLRLRVGAAGAGPRRPGAERRLRRAHPALRRGCRDARQRSVSAPAGRPTAHRSGGDLPRRVRRASGAACSP